MLYATPLEPICKMLITLKIQEMLWEYNTKCGNQIKFIENDYYWAWKLKKMFHLKLGTFKQLTFKNMITILFLIWKFQALMICY